MLTLIVRLSLIIAGLTYFVSSESIAQNFFSSGSNNATTADQPQKSRVLSPEEFKAKVNTLNNATKSSISQELDQQLKAHQQANPMPAGPTGTSTTTKPASEQNQSDTNKSSWQTVPPVVETPPENPAPAATKETPPPLLPESAVPPPPPIQTQPIAPAQSPGYTGFGTGTQNPGGQPAQAPATAPANNQSGWGVKY